MSLLVISLSPGAVSMGRGHVFLAPPLFAILMLQLQNKKGARTKKGESETKEERDGGIS